MGTINTTKLILNQSVKMAESKQSESEIDKNKDSFVMSKKIVLTTDNIAMVKKSQAEKKVKNARNIKQSKKSVKDNIKSRVKRNK